MSIKKFLTRVVMIVVLAAGASWLWSHRDFIADLSNSNLLIQGEWHRVEMDFPDTETYVFTENLISVDGEEWATYEVIRGSRIEITTRHEVVTYELSFPDDENMVWSTRSGDKLTPVVKWRR